MKKFAMALALALPMVFVSCDKNEDETTNEPNNEELFAMPVLDWGATQESVKNQVDTQEFVLDETNSDAETLFYETIDTTLEDNMPWYVYDFDNNALDAASIIIPASLDDTFDTWLKAIGYTVSVSATEDLDDENDVVYVNNADLTKATTAVIYGPISGTKNYIGTFINLDDVRGGRDFKAIVARAKANAAKKF